MSNSKWWRFKHAVKYSNYRPKWIAHRIRERRLTLKRGYATFVLDEFDYYFNELAVASLRYHLSPECVCDNEHLRPKYEALIERLLEPEPTTTEDESAAIDTWSPFTELVGGRHMVTECPPVAQAAFDSWTKRQEEHAARISQARKDFVDIMPGLWS